MAYFKITKNSEGKLVAKVQISGKEPGTGKTKLYVKRFYNTDNLSEAKFRKQVDLLAAQLEREINIAYQNSEQIYTKVLTFSELMSEWKATVKANQSLNYYMRVCETEKRFTAFLKERKLDDKPISDIRVRDIQLFLNSFSEYKKNGNMYRLKKDFPKTVSMRELADKKIIDRNASYNLRRKGTNIGIGVAKRICEYCNINLEEYFEEAENTRPYSQETIKGYRRVLRTLFNEAVRYEWITKNPVCSTKIGAGNNNAFLRAVEEKEVFSIAETKDFLQKLDELGDEFINKKTVLKIMLLTGVRSAEMLGLKWSDVDFKKKVIKVRRNRLYASSVGIYEKAPKTKTSLRDIPMPDALVYDLKRYYDWFKLADDDFEYNRSDYYLAVNIYREPLGAGTIAKWLERFEIQNGFKHVSCHGLRHTYCSMLLSQNVPIQTVSKYMGHSDSTITLQVYSHFLPDTAEKVVTALNNIL